MPPCSTSTGRRRHGFAARTASPWSPGPRTCSRSPAPLPLLPTSLGTGSAATWHPHLPVWADDQDSGRGRTERGRSAMRARTRRAGAALATAGGVVLLRPGTRANRVLRRQVDLMARRLRYLAGRLQGAGYRLRGRHPDADVSDLVLTDRIRSSIGPLEKRLDLPHIHVLVEDHVALLHGVAESDREARELEEAVAGVSGVLGVESYLHLGLTRGDARPSAGRRVEQPSDARRRLLDAAARTGLDPAVAEPVVRAVLATVAERLPDGERNHVAAHLPADVRTMFTPPRRTRAARVRTVPELVARLCAACPELPHDQARQVTAAVVRELRAVVPEETSDIAAVLPADLRQFWERTLPD